MLRVCTLASGSSGNATYIGTKDEGVLIDAGISARQAVKLLASIGVEIEQIQGVLVTHEHKDHVAGLEVLTRRHDLPVYCTEKTGSHLEDVLDIAAERCRCFSAGETLTVGELKVESFSLSHDAADPVGYVINHKDTRVGVVTDTGVLTSKIRKALRHCQALVLEANHDLEMLQKGRYPYPLKQRILSAVGHLSNKDAGAGLLALASDETKHVVLAHLSAENNRADLARDTVKAALRRGKLEKQPAVTVAPRLEPHPLIEV